MSLRDDSVLGVLIGGIVAVAVWLVLDFVLDRAFRLFPELAFTATAGLLGYSFWMSWKRDQRTGGRDFLYRGLLYLLLAGCGVLIWWGSQLAKQ